jgi:hypothetical protein
MDLKKVHQTIKEIYHPPRFKFDRRRIEHLNDMYDHFEVDSGVMSALSKENRNYKYFILLVNTFSKFIYTEAVKELKAKTVCDVVDRMLDLVGHPIHNLYSDKGILSLRLDVFYSYEFYAF